MRSDPEGGENTVFDAAWRGDLDAVKRALESLSPNVTDSSGYGVLHWAALGGHTSIIDVLLRSGATVDLPSRGVGPGVDGDSTTSDQTPLHWAAANGHVAACAALLAGGADAFAKDEQGHGAAIHAAQNGHVLVLAFLLRSVDAFEAELSSHGDRGGATCLHWACFKDRVSTVVYLLFYLGVSPNIRDGTGATPLHWWALSGNRSVLRLLLRAGSDASIQDHLSRRASIVAKQNGRLRAAAMLEDVESGGLPKFAPQRSSGAPYIRIGAALASPVLLFGTIYAIASGMLVLLVACLACFALWRWRYSHFFSPSPGYRSLGPLGLAFGTLALLQGVYWIVIVPEYPIASIYHAAAILLFFGLLVKLCLLEPGIRPPSAAPVDIVALTKSGALTVESFCCTCGQPKLWRGHHCNTCDVCVELFDHHCPWLNVCVGRRNRGVFLGLLTLALMLHCLFAYATYEYFLLPERNSSFWTMTKREGVVVVSAVWNLVWAFWECGVWVVQMVCMTCNYTTVELLTAFRRAVKDKTPRLPDNPHSVGFVENVSCYFSLDAREGSHDGSGD